MTRDPLDPILSVLWDRVDAAAGEAHTSRRRDGIDLAIADIDRALERNDDARLWYLRGYALYVHPDRVSSPPTQSALEHAFHRVLETVPDDALAQLYLGHDAYDRARYDAALAWFSSVDVCQLSEYLQLKVIEMIVCCRLHLSDVEGARDALDRLIERCAVRPIEDIHPLQLLRALETLASRGAGLGALAPSLARLDEAGSFHWFGELAARTPERA